ncbi:hypothetical protein FXV77_03735 [Sphingobacterium phlebotomi]|uniref:Uncharacterized protein n=1 Tax=Sphingobacterium phlebotomi TaxID=2605433 RepID=A0A5D4HHQ8_9SPHI|nr:hypothetical protein [Sphingobacterium phlebotomi]TYR38400.1 hypothetical protein FXV77_03735 [Sphingobacterium phlebotomi]
MTGMFIKISNSIIVALSVLMLLASCDNRTKARKQFVWDEEVKELTGENLYSWLEKAPFDNELERAAEGKIVITNAKQVFPFMGRYYNAIEELRRSHDTENDTVIYTERDILFQDSIWGDLFLSATLLYDNQEVFLDESYIETGNPFFGGTDAVMDMHRAYLYETAVLEKNSKYKAGIYWVSANYDNYLLGFYQQGQLVFETAVPVFRGDTLATLDKLREVSHALGMNIAEWDNAKVADLQRVEDPESFWQDPFQGIYPREYSYDVYLKIKDTPFIQDEKPRKGDYYFAYQSDDGLVELYAEMQNTGLNKEEFVKESQKLGSYEYMYNDVFYEEQNEKGITQGIAKVYVKNQQCLALHFSYEEKDNDAKKQIHSILKYVKVLNYDEK